MHLTLFSFYILFFAATFVWPTWRLWQRERVNPLVLPKDDTAPGLVGNWFRAVLIGLFVMLGALAFGLPAELLGPLTWAGAELVRLTGWGLMIAALGWIMIAQRQMGRSWRIGIDTSDQPQLAQHGLFARSRNPIFLGMRINLLGLFLTLPNAVTLTMLGLGEVLMQVQTRLEEQYLESCLGDRYRAYRAMVPRWF